MVRYISIYRYALDLSKKRKFNSSVDRGSYRGHSERSGGWGLVPGRTQRGRTTGAAQDMVAEEAITLVGDRTVIPEEAEVREWVMVTTLPPSPNDRK